MIMTFINASYFLTARGEAAIPVKVLIRRP